jgi:NADPH:quinone reductase-like Zn-dependent oxidoreductase
METTRVIRFHQAGSPEVLKVEKIPLAVPEGGDVRIRVESMALNRADLLWRAGTYVEDPVFPSRIGYDVAGVIEAIGPQVTTLKVGDRVSSFPAASVRHYGSHGETAIYPENSLIKYPEQLSPAEAVAVNNGLFTGYFPLLEVARLQAGQRIVMTAGSSSTALAALQIAKKVGATAIATTRTNAKKATLLEAGFDHVIVAETDDVAQRILHLTDGRGADVIYDPIAGPGLEALASATKTLGHLIVYGALVATEPTPLPLRQIFIRTVKLYAGYKVFDFTGNPNMGIPRDDAATERAKEFITAGLRSGNFRAKIDRVFNGLDKYADAHRYMESSSHAGKIVILLDRLGS